MEKYFIKGLPNLGGREATVFVVAGVKNYERFIGSEDPRARPLYIFYSTEFTRKRVEYFAKNYFCANPTFGHFVKTRLPRRYF